VNIAPPSFADRRRQVLTAALAPDRRMRICDVGANPLSEPPYAGLLRDGVADVYGFEPNEVALEKLNAVKSDQETYFPHAIGAPGDRTLHLHPRSGFSSLFPTDGESLRRIGKGHLHRPGKTRQVPLRTQALDEVAGLPDIDVLKMDVQGAEAEVLAGGTKRLKDAIAVVTEVRFYRIYEGEPMFGDVDVALRAMGFRLYKFLFTKSVMMPHAHEAKIVRKRMTSQLLDGDAVYLRDGDIVTWSDTALTHLAFAADAIFDAPDLALMALDELIRRGAAPEKLPDTYIARFRAHQKAETGA